MAKTRLDEVVEYPAKTIRLLGNNQKLLALLSDNPNIDTDSDEAEDVFDNCLFDYLYVDNSAVTAKAYVCIEAEVKTAGTSAVRDMRVYVNVICHKDYMRIDPSKFTGLIGNRRDNIVRYIDNILENSPVYGIGVLRLGSVKTIPVPAGFTGRELVYEVADFKEKKLMG